ncbi:vacuolar protein sorting-associated protein 16B [Macrosteles quadrilineatus]|uniref:vacuolar protein sorting-associated protein 16B n=1 Tax=Macrosteles quadrilineatus TaxID=74068 RepID=UPI0023E34943|nr:vacuolar protein sorting-associated protein 16B [Macrosteles quadrilineatus]
MADDDFWNESQVKKSAKKFSFDDRETTWGSGGESTSLQMCGISLDGTAQLFQQVQAGLKQGESESSSVSDSKRSNQLELHQLISEKSLNILMEADSPQFINLKSDLDPAEELRILRRRYEEMWVSPDAKKTVRKMMLKEPFILELFRSLKDKKKLLQEAIDLGDGDTILTVVIFLSRTLKKTYFNQILLEMPVAATHYVAYLSTRMKVSELTDLLEMLGKNKDASMKQFEIACQNSQRQMQRLVTCSKNHLFEGRDSQILEHYIKFLEWQAEAKIGEESVVDCLFTLCELHWGEAKPPLSPLLFTQLQGVCDKQYQWTAITALAKRQAWQDIQTFLMAKSWLRGPKLRVTLPLDHIVVALHSSGAPEDTLYTFLQLIDNVDKRLVLARQVACDKAIIQASMNLRDKQSLPSLRS